jgi:hypothetical protein
MAYLGTITMQMTMIQVQEKKNRSALFSVLYNLVGKC